MSSIERDYIDMEYKKKLFSAFLKYSQKIKINKFRIKIYILKGSKPFVGVFGKFLLSSQKLNEFCENYNIIIQILIILPSVDEDN